MQVANLLLREAARTASGQAVRRVSLLADLIRLEALPSSEDRDHELARLRTDAENCAAERLLSYTPENNGDLICPRCWIIEGVARLLQATPGDKLSCDECKSFYGRSARSLSLQAEIPKSSIAPRSNVGQAPEAGSGGAGGTVRDLMPPSSPATFSSILSLH